MDIESEADIESEDSDSVRVCMDDPFPTVVSVVDRVFTLDVAVDKFDVCDRVRELRMGGRGVFSVRSKSSSPSSSAESVVIGHSFRRLPFTPSPSLELVLNPRFNGSRGGRDCLATGGSAGSYKETRGRGTLLDGC
jgi:hypothetical protein